MTILTTCLLFSVNAIAADSEESFTKYGKQQVLDKLNDPDSAKFRKVKVQMREMRNCSKQKEVCGEVNWRGPGGGYVGYQPFSMGQDGIVTMGFGCDSPRASDAPACPN